MNPAQPDRPASRALGAGVLIACVFVLVGVLLAVTVGSSFVFFYRDQYRTFAGWAATLLVPAFAVAMFRERAKNPLLVRRPTWWARWLLMYPLIAVPGAALVLLAPVGWIAAVALATGTKTEPLLAHLLSVGEHRRGKSCDQRGTLLVKGHYASICLEGLMALPAQGDIPVIVTGTVSPAGLVVARIAPR